MKKVLSIASVFIVFALFFTGCQTVPKVQDKAEAAPEATVEPTKTVAAKSVKYTVKKGDTLWDISKTSKAYKDPFLWPLLYKANRDQIQDPDIIEIGQQFDIKKDFSADEISAAREQAKNTPPYRPKRAKGSMPLKY